MARLALKVKNTRNKKKVAAARAKGKTIKLGTRTYNRCKLCGRVNGYMRRFEICRICFRELAREGKIMGVKKSSW
jgi:small subunit ribosomal protein S14